MIRAWTPLVRPGSSTFPIKQQILTMRQSLPHVLRGASGLCRWRMSRGCKAHGVRFVVRMAKNPRLHRKAEALLEHAARDDQATGQKQHLFGSVSYGTRTWDRARRR